MTLIAILAALWIFWGFGYQTVWGRLGIEVAGVVTARTEVTASSRGGSVYVLRDSDGAEHEYIAGATDASLSRDFALGTRIEKKEGELSFLENGARVNDFPIYAYSATLGIALACLAWGGLRLGRPHV